MLTYRKAGIKNEGKARQLYLIFQLLLFIQPVIFVSGQDSIYPVQLSSPRQIKAVTIIDFFTTFAGIHFINGQSVDEKNSLYLYYNFTINNKINAGKFLMTNYYFNELGVKKYIDSITTISEDQYNFKTSASYRFGKSRFLFNLAFNSKSQYYNHFNCREDTAGKSLRYLYTSYLSPGYNNYSGGIKFEVNSFCSIELGLVNGKKTKIRNQMIYDTRDTDKLYGLNKGEPSKTEFGLSLVFTVLSHQIMKNLFWENFSQFNVNKNDFSRLNYCNADINNAFHFKFLNHFRLTLRTKFLYDIYVSSRPKVVNNLTLGFFLNNTF